jgi:hypothetical protein
MSAPREQVAAQNAIREIRDVLERSAAEDTSSRAAHKWSWSSGIVPDETICDPRGLSAEDEAVVGLFVASLTMKDGGGDRGGSMDESGSDDDEATQVDPVVPVPSSGNCRKRPFSFGIFPAAAAEDRAAKVQDSVVSLPVVNSSEAERKHSATSAANPLSKFGGSKFGLPGIQDRAGGFNRNASRQGARFALPCFSHSKLVALASFRTTSVSAGTFRSSPSAVEVRCAGHESSRC